MDYEPITKGLRERLARLIMSGKTEGELADLCDNIDAIHRSLEAENERLRDASERGDDWIKLPVDADGVPIRVGDEVFGYGWPDGGVYCKAIVNACTILVGEADQRYSDWLMWDAADTRHYHAPTVEDVLRKFAADFVGCANCVDDHEVTDAIELFAPKLRLAGECVTRFTRETMLTGHQS